MRAIDLASSRTVSVDETATLSEIAKTMRLRNIGDVVVMRQNQAGRWPIGVVTDRDIVVHGFACDLDPRDVRAADLCTREPVCVDADADLVEITAIMSQHGVRRLLVTRNAELIGVISIDDVIDTMAGVLGNLSGMLSRQMRYEKDHLVAIG